MLGDKNRVRASLDASAPSVGTFLMEFNTLGIGPIAAHAGADFVFWDLQHTGWTHSEIAAGLASLRDQETVAGVRVDTPSADGVSKALDLGAQMVMVPAVPNAAVAREVVSATRYPVDPNPGSRAVTFSVAWDGYAPPAHAAEALRNRNENVVVFAQIETAEGLRNVREIAAVDGIDVLWVGDGDLAASLGVPGDFSAPAYTDALRTVADAARRSGKAAGFTTTSTDVMSELRDIGYSVFAFGNDIKLFSAALTQGVGEFKTRLAAI